MAYRIALLALLLPAVAWAEPAEIPTAVALLDRHAPALVEVEMVLLIKQSRGGQTRESDRRATAMGLVVDRSGMVMMGGSSLAAGRPDGMGERNVDITPREIRVRFAGEEKTYRASLVATDADLGLAFVRIDDLGDRVPATVDFAAAAEPTVGAPVILLGRRARAFDDAPYFRMHRVSGELLRPRRAWMTDGRGREPGQPVFTPEGMPVGVIARIAPARGADEGARGRSGGRRGIRIGSGGGMGSTFILPAAVVRQRIGAALAEAKNSATESTPGPAGAATEEQAK